jgi:2'-5' RNA ligase
MSKTAKDYALKGRFARSLHTALTVGYCTWLVPDSASEPALGALVSDLAGLEPPAPSFIPHITLLSPKNAFRQSAEDLSRALEAAVAARPAGPLRLTLEAPAPGTFYYQCMLAPVVPSEQLAALRAAVEDAVDEHPKVFFPHLSLLYGDLDEGRKRELCAEASARATFPMDITVTEAVVVDINGTAPEWKIVHRVKL